MDTASAALMLDSGYRLRDDAGEAKKIGLVRVETLKCGFWWFLVVKNGELPPVSH